MCPIHPALQMSTLDHMLAIRVNRLIVAINKSDMARSCEIRGCVPLAVIYARSETLRESSRCAALAKMMNLQEPV